MELSDYQYKAYGFAIYPREINLAYPALGLAGEAGEVANKIKKVYRDNTTGHEIRHEIAKELGDVLWYVAAVATEFGLELDSIAQANLDKLESRRDRGVIGGSGDDR